MLSPLLRNEEQFADNDLCHSTCSPLLSSSQALLQIAALRPSCSRAQLLALLLRSSLKALLYLSRVQRGAPLLRGSVLRSSRAQSLAPLLGVLLYSSPFPRHSSRAQLYAPLSPGRSRLLLSSGAHLCTPLPGLPLLLGNEEQFAGNNLRRSTRSPLLSPGRSLPLLSSARC